MSARDIKKRIFAGRELPAFPRFGRSLLQSLQRAPTPQNLLQRLADEPELRAQVSRLLQAHPSPDQALFLVFQQAALRVYPLASGGGTDKRAFWKLAFASAGLAAGLAKEAGNVAPAEAYVAALFHDIGKLALEQLLPEESARAAELSRTQGLFVLEAERRELGVDHTLAGKWVAEAWGMPTRICDAIWLHHHPAGLVASGPYPSELVHVVALSDLLARHKLLGTASARFSAGIEDRRKRLNLSADLLQQMQPSAPPWESAPIEAPAPERVHASVDELERELKRVKGLYQLFRGVARGHTLEDALTALAEALRDTYQFPAGICLLETPEAKSLTGKSWKSLEGTIEEIVIPAHGEQGRPALSLRLLRKVLGSASVPASLLDSGLLVLPLGGEEELRGQLLLDASSLPLADRHAVLEDLMQFLVVALEALGQGRRRFMTAERQEALTADMWRQELQHHQSLRQERLASVQKLAAGAAHEINNPMAIISGQAQLLLGRATAPEDVRALEQIIQQTRRAGRVVGNLSQFAKPPAPRVEPLLVSTVLHAVLDPLRERLAQAGIQVAEDYGKLPPKVLLDARQMEQVFQHLIENAERAMLGGGTLGLRARASRDRKSVVIQVADDGVGIAPEHINHVFEPFVSLWEEQPGLGMGLAVCHGIVEAHRGAIALHSHPGEGTTCTITLPAAGEAAGTAPATADRPQESPVFTLLLADRQEELREVLQETLAARGFSVRTAADSLEAMAALMGHPFDLVLLDNEMYTPRGIPLLRQIRERYPSLPIIAISEPSAGEPALDALQMGAQACLVKPFRLEQLFQELERLIGRRNVA